MTTGIPTSPCTTPYGDLLLALQLQNKADWARLHGYELHAMAEEVYAGLRTGPWQKVAFLQKVRYQHPCVRSYHIPAFDGTSWFRIVVLEEVPPSRAEWILWVDMDVILADTVFDFPFAKYSGKDLVMWGRPDDIERGNPHGINSGILLLRNSKWSRKLLEDMSYFGVYPTNFTREAELRSALPGYEYGLFDQTALGYLLKTKPSLMSKVRLENDFCINCWYKDIYSPQVTWPPFIVHFAGCQLCSGFHPEKLGVCGSEFLRLYAHGLNLTRHWATQQLKESSRDFSSTNRRVLLDTALRACMPMKDELFRLMYTKGVQNQRLGAPSATSRNWGYRYSIGQVGKASVDGQGSVGSVIGLEAKVFGTGLVVSASDDLCSGS
eukprot:jgi/Botrbrau1/1342/Bobra.0063s0053.1